MDGYVHSHSKPWGLKEREIFSGRNIWSPLKGRKFVAAERLHLRAQGIAAVFASHRHAVTGTRSCTAVQEGANLSQNAPTHHQFSHDVNKCVKAVLLVRPVLQLTAQPAAPSHCAHPHTPAERSHPGLACPALYRPSRPGSATVGLFMWLWAEVTGLPLISPSGNP